MQYVLAVIIVLLILVACYTCWHRERFGNPVYLDQIAMANSDPTRFRWTGNERDPMGMSGRDYYLENTMYSSSLAAPQRLEKNDNYVSQVQPFDQPGGRCRVASNCGNTAENAIVVQVYDENVMRPAPISKSELQKEPKADHQERAQAMTILVQPVY